MQNQPPVYSTQPGAYPTQTPVEKPHPASNIPMYPNDQNGNPSYAVPQQYNQPMNNSYPIPGSYPPGATVIQVETTQPQIVYVQPPHDPNKNTILIFLILGFCFPILWAAGFCFRKKNYSPATRQIANICIILFFISVVGSIVYAISVGVQIGIALNQ